MAPTTPSPQVHSGKGRSSGLATDPASNDKPVVVGVYGIPGSGKTFLLNQLRQGLGNDDYAFYEGSEMIDRTIPGGLEVFQTLDKEEKVFWRQCAIDKIGQDCANNGQAAIVTGHYSFWPDGKDADLALTENDLSTYTHILYLDVPAEVIFQQRLGDTGRSRPIDSVDHLCKWQNFEKDGLRNECYQNGILFSLVSSPLCLGQVTLLLRDFRHHSEEYNLSYAERKLAKALATDQNQLETVLVLDADKTLAAEDAGDLFWRAVTGSHQLGKEHNPLSYCFGSSLGYSYTAFRQATLLYEDIATSRQFQAVCDEVVPHVTIHPEFISLLKLVGKQKHVRAILLTCGLRCVWDQVLEREGLSTTVETIGGGRIGDGYVITPAVKGALVARLRHEYKVRVWAFGDSPMDLDMLGKADQAIVVVGPDDMRSRTMDAELERAVDEGNLRARQVVLPSDASPRLDTARLPLVDILDPGFVDSMLCRWNQGAELQVHHATDKTAAKLLMTPTRDAAVAGPALRRAHRRVGWYLATEFLSGVIGIEEYRIPHVQGHDTVGYRLSHEHRTTIVALMRGGEPMAYGVNAVFPDAMFVHANGPEHVELQHLQGQHAVVLVDSVMNSGKTVMQFVDRVRHLHPTIRIVIVVGVAQAQATSGTGFAEAMAFATNVSLVALRLSDNSFTGRGATDTGNRLFNTMHLP